MLRQLPASINWLSFAPGVVVILLATGCCCRPCCPRPVKCCQCASCYHDAPNGPEPWTDIAPSQPATRSQPYLPSRTSPYPAPPNGSVRGNPGQSEVIMPRDDRTLVPVR
jgi:hypothetical protein